MIILGLLRKNKIVMWRTPPASSQLDRQLTQIVTSTTALHISIFHPPRPDYLMSVNLWHHQIRFVSADIYNYKLVLISWFLTSDTEHVESRFLNATGFRAVTNLEAKMLLPSAGIRERQGSVGTTPGKVHESTPLFSWPGSPHGSSGGYRLGRINGRSWCRATSVCFSKRNLLSMLIGRMKFAHSDNICRSGSSGLDSRI